VAWKWNVPILAITGQHRTFVAIVTLVSITHLEYTVKQWSEVWYQGHEYSMQVWYMTMKIRELATVFAVICRWFIHLIRLTRWWWQRLVNVYVLTAFSDEYTSMMPPEQRMKNIGNSTLCYVILCFDAVGWVAGTEGHPACRNWVMRCWRGYLSWVRYKWFAYGPADATATPSSLAPVKSRMVYLSGASLSRLSWKKGH